MRHLQMRRLVLQQSNAPGAMRVREVSEEGDALTFCSWSRSQLDGERKKVLEQHLHYLH